MSKWILQKEDPMTIYFKSREGIGHTWTSTIEHGMMFSTKDEAIDYNYKWLYGDCEVVKFNPNKD